MAKETDKAPNPGDRVKAISKGEVIEGIFIQSPDKDVVVIKLHNGYNVGMNIKDVKSIEVLDAKKEVKEQNKAIKDKKNLKKIMILHTGGTIASKVDYASGGVIAKFSAQDMISMFPEIAEIANIETELVANMMSEDMMFSDHQKMAAAIKKHADSVDGIIIGHGTDTLAYTSASLAFMFEKINIPVLLVGSQRSTDRGSTDGAMNIACAAIFIANTDFTGIAICMHHSSSDDVCAILPATKTRKMHTTRRDAFKPINDTPIALIDYKTRGIKILKSYAKKTSDNRVVLKDKMSDDVGLLKTHPNMKNELFEFFAKTYKGFVLEATGLGQAPTNLGKTNLKNYETLRKYLDNGGIVTLTSQCLYGRVNPTVYTNCRRLSSMGVIFCEDMLPETAFIKLSWLLGNYPASKVKELMAKNLRGEITDFTNPKDFIE